ncbi:MAG: TerC family protein [Syntrophomonadaceae bacterium]|nr:TerC family protein [Syntrophomonadaceae bacterium]
MNGFEWIVPLLSIIIIDIVLGGDNAIVIALASKCLPPRERRLAMYWGTAGAVAVRAALTAVALLLLKIPLLQFIGGLLLIWIAVKLLVEDKDVQCKEAGSLGEAIRIIIIADVVMGIDNVIAIAGAAHGSILLVVIGLLVSVPIIMWGSTFILKLMERYPFIVYIGGGVLAWTAGQMMAGDRIIAGILSNYITYPSLTLSSLVVLLVLGIGYYKNQRGSALPE